MSEPTSCSDKECFLSSERACNEKCQAFDPKSKTCKVIQGIVGISSNLRVMVKWLGHSEAPKV